jgi:hypothetical protein
VAKLENGAYDGTKRMEISVSTAEIAKWNIQLFMANLQTKEATNVKVQDQNNVDLFF